MNEQQHPDWDGGEQEAEPAPLDPEQVLEQARQRAEEACQELGRAHLIYQANHSLLSFYKNETRSPAFAGTKP